jgi:DNA-binding MarR family transcriptional regulator
MPMTVVRAEASHLYVAAPEREPAAQAVAALLRVHAVEEREIEAIRLATGLTVNEFHAVRYLLQAQRDARDVGPRDLGVMLSLSPGAVTKLVDQLVGSGYVRREAHASDRRAQRLVPTPEIREKIDAAYHRFHEAVVSVLGAQSDEDNAVIARVLDAITGALEGGR